MGAREQYKSRLSRCAARMSEQPSLPSWTKPLHARGTPRSLPKTLCHPDRSVRRAFPPLLFAAGGRGVEGPAVSCPECTLLQKGLPSLKRLSIKMHAHPGLRFAASWANGRSTTPTAGFGRLCVKLRCAGTAVSLQFRQRIPPSTRNSG
jgi:hypothetical protein